MSEYLQLHDMPALEVHLYKQYSRHVDHTPDTEDDEEIHRSSDVQGSPCTDSTMQREPFDAGRAAPKAIRSYHFKIQVLQSEGAENVRTWQFSRRFSLASPPFHFD